VLRASGTAWCAARRRTRRAPRARARNRRPRPRGRVGRRVCGSQRTLRLPGCSPDRRRTPASRAAHSFRAVRARAARHTLRHVAGARAAAARTAGAYWATAVTLCLAGRAPRRRAARAPCIRIASWRAPALPRRRRTRGAAARGARLAPCCAVRCTPRCTPQTAPPPQLRGLKNRENSLSTHPSFLAGGVRRGCAAPRNPPRKFAVPTPECLSSSTCSVQLRARHAPCVPSQHGSSSARRCARACSHAAACLYPRRCRIALLPQVTQATHTFTV
jgi:hypothetical protein